MGYTTDFTGEFNLDRPFKPEHAEYLRNFSETRRMKRDALKAATLPDPMRVAVGLLVGPEGGYFVGGAGFAGQDHDASIVDYNHPPEGQPGLWCQWIPNADGTAIEWDGGEKFYAYVKWLQYLIDHFLKPWGYTLNGSVRWQGEESSDRGTIIVANNSVTSRQDDGGEDGPLTREAALAAELTFNEESNDE